MPHVLQCEIMVGMVHGSFLWIAETEVLGSNGVWINQSMPD